MKREVLFKYKPNYNLKRDDFQVRSKKLIRRSISKIKKSLRN